MADGLVLVLGLALVLAYAAWRTFRVPTAEPALPRDLVGATLAFSEETVRSPELGFAARVDQVYRTRDGALVPVENKHRRVPHASDAIQLSVQAAVIGQQRGVRVSRHGYVRLTQRTQPGDPPRYAPVALLDSAALERLRQRYVALRRGAEPAGPATPTLCGSCAYAPVCPKHRARVTPAGAHDAFRS